MNNFKKLLASAMALSMVTSVLPMANPVSAANTIEVVEANGWESFGASVTPTNDGVVIGKEIGGAVNKSNTEKITAEGTSVATYVNVDLKEHGQLFVLSAGVNNEEGNYTTEFAVMTQKDGNKYVVTTGFNDKKITFEKDGVYTYIWTFVKGTNGKLSAKFTVEYYGDVIGTINVDEIDVTDGNADSIRYLWAFGRDNGGYQLDEKLTIYEKLPARPDTTSIDDAINNKGNVVDLLNTLGDVTDIPADEVVMNETRFDKFLADNRSLFENALKYASIVGYNEDQVAALKHLVGTEIGSKKIATDFAKELVSSSLIKELKDAVDAKKIGSAQVNTYNKVAALLAFKGNVASKDEDKVADIEDLFADLEADVKDYKEDNVGKDAKKFAEALANEVVAGLTVSELVDDEAPISYTKRSTVESFIKKVTKDSYTLADVRYGDVKNEGVVEDYIEGLETIVDEMKEVKELLDDTKAEKKAFDKLSGKLSNLVEAITEDKLDADKHLDGIEKAVAAFRANEVKALKDYVDTVVNEFWTVATEQRVSGTYRVKEVNAGLGRYYSFNEVAGAKLHELMTTLVDSDDEETWYDLLVADAASVDELLKAVTTDIEGITLNSTVTDKEAAKIIAANKALKKLDANSKEIYNSLTRSERADVDANRELIGVMYLKLILNGNVVKDGWVDLGNGNWDYFVEGKAFTGWVCSAKDVWYYVRDGHMLRNAWVWRDDASAYYVGNDGIMVYGPTTVDGYALDANGLWHK